ncbi:hypothetical protein [Shewanella algae]|uniref:hypothetical protein n=1 Tax=Shewanella algae TaxID=38313 RepID=UPI000AC86509|nr:hypothetical protein [Shewanella algae]
MNRLLFTFMLFSTSAMSNDWSEPTEVYEINTGYKGGMILFKTVSPHYNPNSVCNAALYAVKSDTADVSHILSVLLTAQSSRAKIQVGVDSSTCSSDNNKYISVSRIRIGK